MDPIREVREIALEDLTISKGQARLRDVGKDIDELADSIAKLGLLEPIVVSPSETVGKFEILTGQRRFLAHQRLGRKTILAAILPERVDEIQAKIISVTENLIRRDLNPRDLIDACTALYKKYGTVNAVAEETGLPPSKVREYVKYERLRSELRDLVDEQGVDIKVALRAQDAASVSGEFKAEDAVKLAKEMAGMSGVQQKKVVEARADNPTTPLDEVIESAKTGAKVTQVVVTLGADVHRSLQSFAKTEGTSQDDAAAELIAEGLSSRGYVEGA